MNVFSNKIEPVRFQNRDTTTRDTLYNEAQIKKSRDRLSIISSLISDHYLTTHLLELREQSIVGRAEVAVEGAPYQWFEGKAKEKGDTYSQSAGVI